MTRSLACNPRAKTLSEQSRNLFRVFTKEMETWTFNCGQFRYWQWKCEGWMNIEHNVLINHVGNFIMMIVIRIMKSTMIMWMIVMQTTTSTMTMWRIVIKIMKITTTMWGIVIKIMKITMTMWGIRRVRPPSSKSHQTSTVPVLLYDPGKYVMLCNELWLLMLGHWLTMLAVAFLLFDDPG